MTLIDTSAPEIQAYFSHSYRAADREVNLFFWRLFSSQGFYFTVDPKSDRTIVPHLERMMKLSDCFIAIVTRRLEMTRSFGDVILPQPQEVLTHSPYIEFENRLSIRSGKPRLIFVESGLNANLFGPLEEVHTFDREMLRIREEIYRTWVREFASKVQDYKRYADLQNQMTRKAGILIDMNRARNVYSQNVLNRITRALWVGGYTATIISPHIADDQQFIRDLADVELLVSEMREPFVTPTSLAFVHAKFIPTIRLCHLRPSEDRKDIVLPDFLGTGYTVGDIDPIIAWNSAEELVLEMFRYIQKFQQSRTLLSTFDEGRRYFMSAGRRSAKVFVSNAHTLNDLALELIKGFQTFNIQFFHYQANLDVGVAWQEELKRELNECEVFVVLISDEYHTSIWCQYELEYAFNRWKDDRQVSILPYIITQTGPPELIKDYIQCAFMHNMESKDIVDEIVTMVGKHLREEMPPPKVRAVPPVTPSEAADDTHPPNVHVAVRAIPPGASIQGLDYIRGLEAFKRLAESTNWYRDFTSQEARLHENLGVKRRHGDSPELSKSRSEIVDELNRLALEHLNISFNDLCMGKHPFQVSEDG